MTTPQYHRSAVLLLSGGQDSTTCLYWAKKYFGTVYCLGFDYGQQHREELSCAALIAERAGCPFQVMNVRGLLAPSSLTEHTDHNAPSYINPALPASFTAGRNLLFLTIAGSYAASLGGAHLVTGVCETDYSGYPDCRRSTIDAQELTLTLGLGVGLVKIHTPLMFIDKAQTWKLAAELGCLDVIVNDTLTDYNGSQVVNEWGRGELNNPASVLRAKGYYEAKERGWLGV